MQKVRTLQNNMLEILTLSIIVVTSVAGGQKVFRLISENVDVVNSSQVLRSENVSSVTQCSLMCSTGYTKCDGFVLCEEFGGKSFICKSVCFHDVINQLKPSTSSCSYYEVDYCGKGIDRELTAFLQSTFGMSIAGQFFDKRMEISCSSLKETTLLEKGKLIDTISMLSKSWLVSFDLKITGSRQDGYRNIIHFTTGGSFGKHGYRIPGVWFHSGSFRLQIASAINNDDSYIYKITDDIPKNISTNVLIIQYRVEESDKYIYAIYINRKEHLKIINNNAAEFSNVKVYASNPWGQPANAVIRNFIYRNLE